MSVGCKLRFAQRIYQKCAGNHDEDTVISGRLGVDRVGAVLYLLEGQSLHSSVCACITWVGCLYLELLDDSRCSLHALRLKCEHRVVALHKTQSAKMSGPIRCWDSYVERGEACAVGVEGLVVVLDELLWASHVSTPCHDVVVH